jgi:hypothetical protein
VIDWSEWPELTCAECGQGFRLSERNTRAWLRGERSGQPVCPDCRELRAVGRPGPEHRQWLEAMPADELDRLIRQVSLLAE